MAGANTNLDEMRRLQSALNDFCAHMDQQSGLVQKSAGNLDWNDSRYREFMTDMDAWMNDFANTVRTIRQFEPTLGSHIRVLEAY
jgi:hypothetical protein